MSEHWTIEAIPDQTGRTAIVTGANSGIGFEAARALAGKGAHVVLTARGEAKGQRALDTIRAAHPKASLEVMQLDLADLHSIWEFSENFRQKHDQLDLLINNAGVMAIPYRETEDGFEMQFGTNHLGHFALTGRLLEVLLQTSGSRVVTVSSNLHARGKIELNDLMGRQKYDKWAAYGQSKLANLLFAYELDRRLKAIAAATISLGVHPGYANTQLQMTGPEMEGSTLRRWMMDIGNNLFAQSAAMGALPTLYAATKPGLQGGEYVGPDGFRGLRGYPVVTRSSQRSYDQDMAARLWEVSEELTGVKYVALDKKNLDREEKQTLMDTGSGRQRRGPGRAGVV
jgi:NAD(P)-dependent dehydrogenase (short-subunit alcohol dehydrogenase family)